MITTREDVQRAIDFVRSQPEQPGMTAEEFLEHSESLREWRRGSPVDGPTP